MDKKREIYLDYHATTPVLPEVCEAMLPYLSQHFGNANSTHQWGWKAELAVTKASLQVAKLVGADSQQIFFTSGATESIHWALLGWLRQHREEKPLILTTAVEHKATYGACEWAQELGAEVKVLPVDEFGCLSINALKQAIPAERPVLLSFILANNEIGSINPWLEIASLKKDHPNLWIHGDGAQAVGKVKINFKDSGLDFLSLSGHKIYAPKGIGALVVRDRKSIKPLFSGGGQQMNMRAGTVDVASIVALGKACDWAFNHQETESTRLQEMRDYMIEQLTATGLVKLNGHPTERLPNNINVTFQNLKLDQLLLCLPKVAFSSSSACSSGSGQVSHVLSALGLSEEEARRTVRFGLGQGTQWEEIQWVIAEILRTLEKAPDFPFSAQ